MKPLLSLAAILVLLAACSGDGTQTTQTIATPEQSASTPAPQTEAPQTTTYSTTAPAAKPASEAEVYRTTATELKQRVDAGEVVVVDVRSRVAYATEHARGSVNIPLEEIGMRSAELPTDKWLVTYCT